jgi:hypothetical protein
MTTIPVSYEESRLRFRSSLPIPQILWPGACISSHFLPFEEDLSIDWICANALKSKEKLFVLTTGQHGIEGYVGSAMHQIFLEEVLPGFDPQTSGILLVHAINPWGMKHRKRGNPQNVDLNRNFINGSFTSLSDCNPDYPRLSPFLNPKRALGNIRLKKLLFFDQAVESLLRFGVRRSREATLMGQYILPEGVYFGGRELQEETQTLMDLYRASFQGYKQIVHLDIHSGYGPRFQMTLVNSPLEKMNAAETIRQYGVGRVAAANPDEFYSMHGDMIDWEYELVRQEFPKARFFGAACEFGTFGDSLLAGARSWRITIFKNQANLYGASPAAQAWVDREYGELYNPGEAAWFEKAQADARQAFNGVLTAEGYIVEQRRVDE